MSSRIRVSLGRQLSLAKTVVHLGLRCNWEEYTPEERAMIMDARKVYFPTLFYAHVLSGAGRAIFPSLASYNLLGDKIRQTCLFKMLGVPHPRTMFFWGRNRAEKILSTFDFPFVAKIPRESSRGQGVFLITGRAGLDEYLARTGVAYIQEYLPIDRDIRVVVIGQRPVLAYWKIASARDFRTNVARGSSIGFKGVPGQAIDMAVSLASRAGIDHAGIDVCMSERGPMVFEANIHFGTEGFDQAGLSYKKLIAGMADSGEI